MAFTKPQMFASATGASLALRHEPARGLARGVVQINHGLAEHAARYARFADVLAGAGYHVYAHDHRGHGLTTAPDAPYRGFSGMRDGADKVIADVGAVHREIAIRHPGLPVVVFGHSMGGLIAMNYALRHPDGLAAAAVWNANFSAGAAGYAAKAVLAVERFRLGSDVPSRMLPRLTFAAWAKSVPDRRAEFDWLSRDSAEVDAYIADPDCGWDATIGMWQTVFDLIFAGGKVESASPATKALPFNLVGGGRDPATDFGRAVEQQAARLRKTGFADVALTVYPEFRHETLNEQGREQAIDAFIAWLNEKLPDA
ncbi:alpha/beta fold hydrolase [Oricola sp.]|uniref:alpha/beta fold hydrolase n=1 Tax=Oricola sp. TaxID=1979950 RepID=UPI003BAA763B